MKKVSLNSGLDPGTSAPRWLLSFNYMREMFLTNGIVCLKQFFVIYILLLKLSFNLIQFKEITKGGEKSFSNTL